jgi:hypothetical protein
VYSNVSVITKETSAVINYGDVESTGLNIPSGDQAGLGRLVGMGIELVNISSELHKQGNLTMFRGHGLQDTNVTWTREDADGIYQTASFRPLDKPPDNAAEAMLLPGTRSWGAKDGCYMVVSFSGNNVPTQPQPVSPIFLGTDTEFEVSSQNDASQVVADDPNGMYFNRLTPANVCGIFIEGQSSDSVFKLQAVWYYESFPSAASNLITLAKPSCEHDPIALNFYTEVLNRLPVAVPSNWNAAGDWFWDVVTAIKDHAADVGQMIGGTPGKAIGMAATTLAGWGRDRYLTPPGSAGTGAPKQKSKKQKQQNNQPPPLPSWPPKSVVVADRGPTPAELARMTKAQRRAVTQRQQRQAELVRQLKEGY